MRKQILVVDDEADMVSVLVKRLFARGYRADSAGSGAEALKLARHKTYDLFILDIMMPAMDGTALAQHLKDDPRTKGVPLIFLTALQTRQEQAVSLYVGPHIIFAKPYDFDELAGKVDELLSKQVGS